MWIIAANYRIGLTVGGHLAFCLHSSNVVIMTEP